MRAPVVHIHDLPTDHVGPEGSAKFGATIAEVGEALGTKNIGAMYVQVDPGKRMVGRTGVLSQSSRALSAMSAQEMNDIADIARDQLREHLRGYESRSDKGK